MGKLSVFLQADNKTNLYWRFGENVGDIWNAAQFSIPQLSHFKEFSIIFEGESGGETSNMAIDVTKIK